MIIFLNFLTPECNTAFIILVIKYYAVQHSKWELTRSPFDYGEGHVTAFRPISSSL